MRQTHFLAERFARTTRLPVKPLVIALSTGYCDPILRYVVHRHRLTALHIVPNSNHIG